jgi:hypothetical protein
MKTHRTILIALAMSSAAGIAGAQDTPAAGPIRPAVQATEITEYLPLTNSEHLRLFLTDTFGAEPVAGSMARAELNQLRDVPKEWGKGGAGFATRLGSGLGQHLVRQTMKFGAAKLLHEDTRYFRSNQTGFWKRLKYAVASSFLARHPSGRRGFSFASVGSTAGSSFLSRLWMPHTLATAGAGASSFGISIGVDVGINVLREFWPDLKRKFRRQ